MTRGGGPGKDFQWSWNSSPSCPSAHVCPEFHVYEQSNVQLLMNERTFITAVLIASSNFSFITCEMCTALSTERRKWRQSISKWKKNKNQFLCAERLNGVPSNAEWEKMVCLHVKISRILYFSANWCKTNARDEKFSTIENVQIFKYLTLFRWNISHSNRMWYIFSSVLCMLAIAQIQGVHCTPK